MTSFLESMSDLFSFLFRQMGSFANFFISNTLGQIILGCVVFSLIVNILIFVLSKIKGD